MIIKLDEGETVNIYHDCESQQNKIQRLNMIRLLQDVRDCHTFADFGNWYKSNIAEIDKILDKLPE